MALVCFIILIACMLLFLGKSNLMDAISFVLGEKATSLRVKKLSVMRFLLLLQPFWFRI